MPVEEKTIKPVSVGGIAGGEKYIICGILLYEELFHLRTFFFNILFKNYLLVNFLLIIMDYMEVMKML